MTEPEKQQAFYEDLTRMVNRYVDEFEMTYGSFIGILTMKSTEMGMNACEEEEEPEGWQDE